MTNAEEQQSLALNRIAAALERIAAALEPSTNRDDRSFHDLVTDVGELLTQDSSDGALARIGACASDINEAVCGGRANETPITASLEEIAQAVRTQL